MGVFSGFKIMATNWQCWAKIGSFLAKCCLVHSYWPVKLTAEVHWSVQCDWSFCLAMVQPLFWVLLLIQQLCWLADMIDIFLHSTATFCNIVLLQKVVYLVRNRFYSHRKKLGCHVIGPPSCWYVFSLS